MVARSTMLSTTIPLTDPLASKVALTGGKAASLARMATAGFPVPEGFVITTGVFSSAVSEISGRIREMLVGTVGGDYQAVVKASEAVRRLFEDVEIPSRTLDEIRQAYGALAAGAVSVRSTATDEDLAEASFAGQYETYLNVLSLDEVVEKLQRVWSSAYSPQAITYRMNNRLPQTDVEMGVVVQRQLDVEAAGVMFTRNPVTGGDEYMINAAFGLGEGVVSGTVETDHYTVDPVTCAVLSSTVARKETMVAPVPDGGVERVPVEPGRTTVPVLSESQLGELAELGLRLAGLFGGPQDVEFALAGGKVFLLQSRLVTGIEEEQVDWDSSVDSAHHWQIGSMSIERGPAYRLQIDAIEAYARGSRQCFDETGSKWGQRCIVTFVHGYPYLRSPEVGEEVASNRRDAHTAFCEGFYGRGTSNYKENVEPEMNGLLADLWRLRQAGSDLKSRIAYLDQALDTYGYAMGHLHWCISGFDDRPEWADLYHEITGGTPEEASVFLQALPNITTRMIRSLRGLARIVQSDPALGEVFAERRFEDLRSPGLRDRPSFKRFRRRLNDMMRMHGFRTGWSYGSFSDFETPTWNMDPARPLNIIASYVEQDLDELDRHDAEALKERVSATRRVRRRLSKDQDRMARFEAALSRTQGYDDMMEDHNFLMEQCTVGNLRDAIHMAGEALVASRMLDLADDVLHVSIEELRSIAADEGPKDLRALVAERHAEREGRARLSPPPTLGAPALEDSTDTGDVAEPQDDHIVRGTPASRGRVTGTARLVTGSTRVDGWKRGDIMVAENVGQDFTPVFPLLGALVLDGGAVFQHAALIAREYKIPAVVMAGDATKRIADGQTITVDGDAGSIYLT